MEVVPSVASSWVNRYVFASAWSKTNQPVAPSVAIRFSPVFVAVGHLVAVFDVVVEVDPVEAFQGRPAGDPVVRTVTEPVFESYGYALRRVISRPLPVFPEAAVAVVDARHGNSVGDVVRIGRVDDVPDRRDRGQRIGVNPAEPVRYGRCIGEPSGEESHPFGQRFDFFFRIASADVQRPEKCAVHERRRDRITSCGRDRIDQRPYVNNGW